MTQEIICIPVYLYITTHTRARAYPHTYTLMFEHTYTDMFINAYSHTL